MPRQLSDSKHHLPCLTAHSTLGSTHLLALQACASAVEQVQQCCQENAALRQQLNRLWKNQVRASRGRQTHACATNDALRG